MKVYVVTGFNGILNAYGPVGVATTLEGAGKIRAEHEYMLDKVRIDEMEVETGEVE